MMWMRHWSSKVKTDETQVIERLDIIVCQPQQVVHEVPFSTVLHSRMEMNHRIVVQYRFHQVMYFTACWKIYLCFL